MRSSSSRSLNARRGRLCRTALAALVAVTASIWAMFFWTTGASAQVLMGEFVTGGDGTLGSGDPQWVGISSDTGTYQPQHDNRNIQNTTENPQAVDPDVSEYINSVFIIDTANMKINTEEVEFQFDGGDATGDTWNHIIKDATHDIDKNCNDIPSGGINFQRAIGVHASAGITFNLEPIRDVHGADAVKFFSSYAGMDRCGGVINLYAIVSDGEEILGSVKVGPLNANQGEFMQIEIPDEAEYLTLACGGANGSIGCAHGVFADPLISGAAAQLPQRSSSNPGDPATCPPTSEGPISVTISQEGGGAQEITVTETATGPFGVDDVSAPGATIEANAPDGISDDLTYINGWLLLGPFEQPFGAAPPPEEMQKDYLTDGFDLIETQIDPVAGDQVETDFNGAAASTGLIGLGDINPDGVPTWSEWVDNDSTIDFNNYYGGNMDNCMMYAVTYIAVGGEPITADIVLSSDDAVQVLFGEAGDEAAEIHLNSVARGLGGPCATPDRAALPQMAADTVYKIILKIFEGGGGHGFRARLIDSASSEVITDGISISLDPEEVPYTFAPNGVTITWEGVTRDTLADPGLSYEINIDGGVVNFQGDVAGASTLGVGVHNLVPAPTNFGPFADPDFPNAHAIGQPCPGTEISSGGAGEITITAGGVDIWGTADQFMFASDEKTGDFSARVRIAERIMGNNVWAKHGIMARANCSAGSPGVWMTDQQNAAEGEFSPNPPALQWRATQDGNAAWPGAQLPAGLHSNELRLDRCGNDFYGYALDELGDLAGTPGEWVQVFSYHWVDCPDTLHLGLCVTSHDGCNLVTVTFEDWEVLDNCPGPVQGLSCTQNADLGLDLTWTNPSGANPAVEISVQVNGVEIATVPGDATSTTIPVDEFPDGAISTIILVNSSGLPSAECSYPPALSAEGFVKEWLLIGPFSQPSGFGWGAAPNVNNIRLDFITDGVTTQEDVEPRDGDQINTDFGGAASSTGLQASPAGATINPDGVPTWNLHVDADDTINFNDYYGGDVNQNVMYAVVYIAVEEEMNVDIGVASDDAVQILLDGQEVWINSAARGFGGANTVQDTVCGDPLGGGFCTNADPVDALTPLEAGTHTILVKIFEGGGGHGFRLRFQDPTTGGPVLSGIRYCTDPDLCGVDITPDEICDNGEDDDGDTLVDCDDPDCENDLEACPLPGGFRRGDADDNGVVQLTDAIRILAFLFQGGPPPTCDDAADGDDNGVVQLTDAIRILAFLFQGGPEPPAPGSTGDCGPDPTDDELGCESYTNCE